ncbi:MAG TPA: hypothetical protein VE135_16065 [Pyrinomonadaceae bacterium]|nr:hypothetical protein [Pyrinomonadaceae bacterium]
MPYTFRSNGCAPSILMFFLLGAAFVNVLEAQSSPTCSPKNFMVMGQSALAVFCAGDTTGLIVTGVSLYSLGDTSITPLSATITVSHFTTSNRWILLTLAGTEGILKPKQKYRLALNYNVASKQEVLDIDTSETVAIATPIIKSQANVYRATAHVGFSVDGRKLASARVNEHEPCEIQMQDDTKKPVSVTGQCSVLDSLPSESPTVAELSGVDPDRVGLYVIELDEDPRPSLIPRGFPPLQTVFGNPLKIDPKSRFSPQKAPATKDASQYYINFNYAAGVGTVPAWVLDGKIAPQSGIYHGFSFSPVAAANVGNNKLKGQTYTDTVNFGATAQKIFQPKHAVQELLFVPGATYETDKKFDRDNLMGTVDLRYNFAGLYKTQSVGTLQKFYSLVLAARKKKLEDPSAQVNEPLLDDIKTVLVGYALDFHTGLEAGGALLDTTISASSGKAKLVLPTYSIVRAVPQVHGLLEIWKFSIDATMTGRYLFTAENTVVETASHSLFLQQVQGWKGIGSVTGIYNWDPQGHFGITIAYKDGFAPPTYQRVNAVQVGLVLKY